jgi:hypothetical protein
MLTAHRCDVDITYDPPRFKTCADLAELRRPPPQRHTRFRGMHRLYAGCDLMVATTPADLDTGLHLLEVSTHLAWSCLLYGDHMHVPCRALPSSARL